MPTPDREHRNPPTTPDAVRVDAVRVDDTVGAGLSPDRPGYPGRMLYTILIILAIVALVLFILGRR